MFLFSLFIKSQAMFSSFYDLGKEMCITGCWSVEGGSLPMDLSRMSELKVVWDVLIDEGKDRTGSCKKHRGRSRNAKEASVSPDFIPAVWICLSLLPIQVKILALIFVTGKAEAVRFHHHSNSQFGNILTTALQLFPLLLWAFGTSVPLPLY